MLIHQCPVSLDSLQLNLEMNLKRGKRTSLVVEKAGHASARWPSSMRLGLQCLQSSVSAVELFISFFGHKMEAFST